MKNLILLFFALVLTGCAFLPIPHQRNITPKFYGVVTDAQTGMPIEKVQIKVTSVFESPETGKNYEAETYTDENGRYCLVAKERAKWFFIWIISPFEGFCSGKVSYSHPDYEPAGFEANRFNSAAFDGTCTGMKIENNVALKRLPIDEPMLN